MRKRRRGRWCAGEGESLVDRPPREEKEGEVRDAIQSLNNPGPQTNRLGGNFPETDEVLRKI